MFDLRFGPCSRLCLLQGWFKFGGVEFFKINITSIIGEEAAWNSKTQIYLLASAMAEFIADSTQSLSPSHPFAQHAH